MLYHSYFCKNCYNNHGNLSGIFNIGIWFSDGEPLECIECGNPQLYKMSLTDDDLDVFQNISRDPDYLISMDKFKRDVVNNLSDEEFLKIIKVSCEKDFITAMSNLKKNDIVDFNLKLSQMKPAEFKAESEPTTNIPKCPTCGSANVRKISGTKRWVGTGMFGLASSDLGKTMQCDNCGYKW